MINTKFILTNVIKKLYNSPILSIRKIGQGCYGVVYCAKIEPSPYIVTLKTFSIANMASIQAIEYNTIAAHTNVPIPKVYSNDSIHSEYNVLVTEYITGVNCGDLAIPPNISNAIGNKIIDYLIELHTASNAFYGDLIGEKYSSWIDYYYTKAKAMYNNICKNYDNGNISQSSMTIITLAFENYHQIITSEPSCPSLLHGDFNTSNIIIDKRKGSVVSIIDTMNSCWGDRESDLLQLNSKTGEDLELFDKYKQRIPLSHDFYIKAPFYETFAEYNHYANLNWQEDTHCLKCIYSLQEVLKKLNLL